MEQINTGKQNGEANTESNSLITNKIAMVSFGYDRNYISAWDNLGYKIQYSLSIKETAKELKKHGSDIITIYCDWYEDDSISQSKYLKRIEKIAKESGYINNVGIKSMYQEQDGIRHEWKEINGQFIKKEGVN